MPAPALDPAQLRLRCDPSQFDFATTAELAEPEEGFGHARAVEALRLGLEITGQGYNLFALGRPGSGRHRLVRGLLERYAATRPAPPEWCYIHNFADANRPRALSLPPGEGARLRSAMQAFVTELGTAIEAALESDDYLMRVEAIQKDAKQREEQALKSLNDSAIRQGVALLRTPEGYALAPARDGQPLAPEQFAQLPDAERERIANVIAALGEQLEQVTQEKPQMRREMQSRLRAATRDAMGLAAGHLIAELKQGFAAHAQVLAFFDEILKDVVEAGEQLTEQPSDDDDEEPSGLSGTVSLHRYRVNLLVGHASTAHAPVEWLDNPTYANLVGRVDHQAHLGTLLTDFTQIRPGALHRANGGYLMLDAARLLAQDGAWDGLKRALRSGEVRIESLAQALGWVGALPLEPEPVPLALKIVLFGERDDYYLLQAIDPEFDELFKVAADFEDDIARDAAATQHLARLLGAMARSQGLRPLDRAAVARAVEHAARLAGDAGRLSMHTRAMNDLLHEADHAASRAGRAVIGPDDVAQAIALRHRRADRLRDAHRNEVLRGTVLIATEGRHVGQVNGLSVIELGNFSFGQPVRITATARLGEGDLVDIEREAALGGPVHSKGVMILASFLGARFAQGLPLSLAASLVFEQSYGPIEGDSASLAELCALMSALAGVPIHQGLAVTGSVNQHGRVQAVGAVNEKIEGFFDLCCARGLSGEQGVLIPGSNVKHLMLRDDVVEAAAQGRFHIHPVDDIDQAIALLTGADAGAPDHLGQWPDGTVNRRVAAKLAQMSLMRQAFLDGTLHHRRPRRDRQRE